MTYASGDRVLYRVMFPNKRDEWKPGTVDYDLGNGRYSIAPDSNPNWWAERDVASLKPLADESVSEVRRAA
jgi:hypothetical protein